MKINTVVADGLKLSQNVFERSKLRFRNIREVLKVTEIPTLAVISTCTRPDSISYLRRQKRIFKAMGFGLEVLRLERNAIASEVIKKIEYLNGCNNIHGIQLHLPLPIDALRKTREVLDSIASEKDVEGLTTTRYQAMLAAKLSGSLTEFELIAPCTALAILEVIEHYGVDCLDKKAVVLGNGYVTGCPISAMLYKKGAQVITCDRQTPNIASLIRRADILVSAVGKPDFFDLRLVKYGAAVLDLGFCIQNGKMRGDIRSSELKGSASLVTPVPNGIGPITSSMVIRNLVLLWEAKAKGNEQSMASNNPVLAGSPTGTKILYR